MLLQGVSASVRMRAQQISLICMNRILGSKLTFRLFFFFGRSWETYASNCPTLLASCIIKVTFLVSRPLSSRRLLHKKVTPCTDWDDVDLLPSTLTAC